MQEKEIQTELDEIFSYYDKQRDKHTQEMVVSLLRELQETNGYLTPSLKKRVIEVTGVTETFLQCLIKMYPSLKEVNTAHEILACTGERCGKKGGMEILQKLRKELGIKKNGPSADGVFELRTQNCLKHCKTSPNMMIDGVLYSGEQLEDLGALLKRIREQDS